MHLFFTDLYVFQGSIEDFLHGISRNLCDRSLEFQVIFLEQRLNLPENHLVLVFAERGDSTFVDAQAVIRNHLLDIYLVYLSQTLAVRAGTFRRIEREHIRCRILVGYTGNWIHQAF